MRELYIDNLKEVIESQVKMITAYGSHFAAGGYCESSDCLQQKNMTFLQDRCLAINLGELAHQEKIVFLKAFLEKLSMTQNWCPHPYDWAHKSEQTSDGLAAIFWIRIPDQIDINRVIQENPLYVDLQTHFSLEKWSVLEDTF